MNKLLFIFFSVIGFVVFASAQEVVRPLSSNSMLRKGPPGGRARTLVSPDTLSLPFRDDFSNKSNYPDTSKWLDNYVFINNTYPTNNLSYGVATFDGLNQYGIAYAYAIPLTDSSAFGADTLTSKPIDLSSFVAGDNVYFSFSYEPQGLGDWPDQGDSLILEFSENDTIWDTIWTHDGFTGPVYNATFTDVSILLDDLPNASTYFRKGFQFRFRNDADLNGNNNHWHLDYVYLNNQRPANDTFQNDLTFLHSPGYFLKNYTAMPWNQFYNYQSTETGDTVHFCVLNHFNTTLSPTIKLDVTEKISNTSIPTQPFGGGFNINSEDSFCLTEPVSLFTPITFTPADSDSVVMSVRTYVDLQTNDFYPDNDTVSTDVNFFNYLAYDDGSAEKAFGLEGENGLLKFAYEFHLNHPDTLRGILIHFTTIEYNTANDLFSLMVWKHINTSNSTNTNDTDVVLYEEDFREPLFVDSLNGFATFTIKDSILDTLLHIKGPLLVSDTFYIGWQQTTEENSNGSGNIEVGLDLNDDARQHMFFNDGVAWSSTAADSTIPPCAPLIRPVIGKDVQLVDTYINSVEPGNNAWHIYPNPVSNLLYTTLKGEKEGTYAEVYDLTGRLVIKQVYNNSPINVSALQPGLYLLRFSTAGEPVGQVARFVKI